ncbi:MAG: RecBCD enzyme subunit RecB [Chlamydiae bacterium]|nr:RecBCD enzyme subunit RecB [Chlamydiota bacterium]
MKSFQVLDRNQKIHRNYFLEASAGTGKTFSIENIVVRLLVEKEELDFEKILVVTFTRAATRDLKVRIRANIENALAYLQGQETPPDYLQSIIEKGLLEVTHARKRLERALFCFDQAQIFTIHSFCARMLNEYVFEGGLRLDAISMDDPLPRTKMLAIVRDFFRTGINPKEYSEEEINLVLADFYGDLEKLENTLLDTICKGIDIEEVPPLSKQLDDFNAEMLALKKEYGMTSEAILQDFYLLAPLYRGLRDKKRQLKKEVIDKVTRFANLFDLEVWKEEEYNTLVADQLFLSTAFAPENMGSRSASQNIGKINIPNLSSVIRKHLSRFVSPTIIFARLACDCQKLFRKYLEKEEKFGFDEILKAMKDALANRDFLQNVQSKYKAAIVDEFQDTDPMQWEIFQQLFLGSGYLYLVGDPKQSIYAFRQADIYTYLSASKLLGEENLASLDTNYRSHPSLIHALNTLFATSNSPRLMPLPHLNQDMPYPEVKSPPNAVERGFSDGRGSVHFYIAEEASAATYPLEKMEQDHFFPFMVQEIQRLSKEDGIPLNQFTVLVSDRFQGKRVAAFLNRANIPTLLQRSGSLAESSALAAFRELLQAVFSPRNLSSLKTALGGKVIRWTHEQVRELEDSSKLEKILYQFHRLKRALYSEGIASFYQQMMHTCWHEDGCTVVEFLLSQEDSAEFYSDFQQIAEILFEFENSIRSTPEALLAFLDDFKTLFLNDDNRTKRLTDLTKNAVNIMTLHASKGLEFDVVFTLGLVKRSKAPEQLVPLLRNDHRCLVAVPDKGMTEYQKHCLEVDAEKIRQLYVGMTRAKVRLYTPVMIVPKSKNVSLGCASPMELFLARLGHPPIEQKDLYSRIHGYNGEPLREFIDKLPKETSITYTLLNTTPSIISSGEEEDQADLQEPNNVEIPGAEKYMHSFTSLSSVHAHKPSTISEAPHDFYAERKTPHTLPSGSETGNLLHKCLESIPLSIFKNVKQPSELQEIVRPYVIGNKYKEWNLVICEILFNAVYTSLEDGLRIVDIDPKQCFHETEFLYGSEIEKAPGYIKGFVDLIFEHRGKYYILDWKSNWLGPQYESYKKENLKNAMQEHNYFLQAQLYTEALQRYLRLVDPRPFKEIFGGVFYLYLRGLHPNFGNEFGVYHPRKCS